MPVWRRSPERRPTSPCGCSTSNGSLAAVRRLAVQARLWKMAPDEMDSRYETLLRRCASTDKRLRVTTVSDVLAGISETLQDTVSRRLPAHSPRFAPCDLVKNAPNDSLLPLEEVITVDSSQEEDNHGNHEGLELKGQSPALITLVSPSTTSLSSAAEGHVHRDRDSSVGSSREAEERSFSHSESPVKSRMSEANGSTTPRRREQRSRRLRRTPVSYYPQMSWRRAHQLVQTRQREARRRRSPYRPLEKNPGWTPLQKAIKRSGILTSPAAYDFVFPDSSTDASNAESDLQRRNHLYNERSHQETKSMPRQSRLQRDQQGEMVYGSLDVTSAERGDRREGTRDKTPPPRERTPPQTPEVIVTTRSSVGNNLSPLARSISVFSDPSSPRRGSKDDDHGIDSTANDDVRFGTPKGSSTPICSAMELFLNAEPFVPRLPNNQDESTLSSVHDPSLQNCLENTPCKFPIQESTAEDDETNASDDDHNGHESENNVAKTGKSPEINHTDEDKAEAARQDIKPAMQQQLIPVIENGVVIPRLSTNEASKAADAATPAISKTTATDVQRQIQGALRNIIPNGLVLPQSDRQCQGQGGLLPTPPPGLGQGFVLLQNVAQIQHIHQQQQQQPIGGLCGVQRQPQIPGLTQGVNVQQQQQNGRTLAQGLLQPQVFQNGQQNSALIIPTVPGVNLQWQRQQQHYQQQQQQPQFQRQQHQRQLGDMNRPGGVQLQNNQRWEPQCQQQHPQQQQQMHALQVQQLHQQQQLQNLQQQQQMNYQQQQQQQAAYRQQQLANATGPGGVPRNNFGTQQHAGFNNNNYGHHPRHHQQLQQPVRPKLPNPFNGRGGAGGIPMLNTRQQHMPANNRVGFNQPVWGH